jgi:hypothetical protein
VTCSDPEAIREMVASLPLADRQALVLRIGADLALVERVLLGTEWLSHRLRGAWSKR